MLRKLHSWPGLIGALFVLVLSVTGTVLALQAALERAASSMPETGQINVAQLADSITAEYSTVDRIERAPSGAVRVYYHNADGLVADLVNPQTGQTTAHYQPSAAINFVRNLHRSLLMGSVGRMIAGTAALLMVVVTLSGMFMLAGRLGGWKMLFSPIRGTLAQRLHTELGRFAVLGLMLSALTGVYMSLVSFGLMTDGMDAEPEFPATVGEAARLPLKDMTALHTLDINDLRELKFPAADDPADVFTLTTNRGTGYIDQGTGQLLSWLPHGLARQTYETIYMLHTGQGLWMLAVLLALTSAVVPVLGLTGSIVWWNRRRLEPSLRHNARPQTADTIILVGSEGNATWGFAANLHAALSGTGYKVHTASMNAMLPDYAMAERMLILTSTYGNGAAPSSASRFFARLQATRNPVPFAVLGFGDRSFPAFCKYAEDVSATLKSRGWPVLAGLKLIDRQSSQDFALWGAEIGKALGKPLVLNHAVAKPKMFSLQLLERTDYGAEVQAPTTIFRFGPLPYKTGVGICRRFFASRLPHFEAGDLVGIVPRGDTVPRFYSLASSASDGEVEICVRKQPGGLCSGQLHALRPGDTIDAFIRENRDFRPAAGPAPLILIGAGAGIGPLVGFARHNTSRRSLHLYWGGRNPGSDFLYESELGGYVKDRRISVLNTIFSRMAGGGYVQDQLLRNAVELRQLISDGAQIMVCGGREMAQGVLAAIDTIVAPLGYSPQTLKAEGRYHEDIY